MTMAQQAGLRGELVQGKQFRHLVFESLTADRSHLLVFIEGDGTPWVLGGTLIARDPTPRRPILLPLIKDSPLSTVYVGRPCYYTAHEDTGCESALWTSARYSQSVVDSIAAVVRERRARGGFQQVILAGHSGGGTLALLAARQLPETAAVITLAANLDIDAWVELHGYTPLKSSLSPASLPPLPSSIQEWHAVGERDRNVPPAINARYWDRLPPGHLLRYPDADHGCCWQREWPGILSRVLDSLADQP